MQERNRILLSIILLLLILILLWICVRFILRRLGIHCFDKEHEKRGGSDREIIHVNDKPQIDYSFEIIQPEMMEKPTNKSPFADKKYILHKILVLAVTTRGCSSVTFSFKFEYND